MTEAPLSEQVPTALTAAGWQRWVPGLGVLRRYRAAWLRRDLAAGLVLTALLVPAGMGYAEAAGLAPIHGLYASAIPLLVYALLGPSRILVLGPDSSLSPLILAAVIPLAGRDPDERAALAAMIAIMAGVLCLAAGLARFGFLTDLLSIPVRYGYLNGIALVILVSQLPKLFGFTTTGTDAISGLREFVEGVLDGDTNRTALAIGLGTLAIILGVRRLFPRAPGILIAVVAAIAAVSLLDLGAEGISLVGVLPQGLPSFTVPSVGLAEMGQLLAAAFGIAVVSFTDTSVLSRSYATREGVEVDSNQELVALGSASIAAGFFQGFSVSGSASRTPVSEAAGARTQVTGVVGAVAILAMLVFLPGLFRNLPTSALAAVVIAAAIKLAEIRPVLKLWTLRRSEFWMSIIAFGGVAVFGVIPGIAIAVGVSLLNFIRRAWRPYTASLARVEGLKGYHDRDRHPEGAPVPGLLLFRFDAPLFFANADFFRNQVRRDLHAVAPPARWVVVTAEPITDIDVTAAEMLASLLDELEGDEIVLAFAEMKGPVKERLRRFGLVERIGEAHFYPTIGEAVKAYLAATGQAWVDWEERPGPTVP